MKRFEVWITDLDPTKGAEMKKVRPCIIVSPDAMNNTLQTVIAAPLTSSQKGYPMRVQTSFQGISGEIVLDQVRCIDKSRLIKRVGKIAANETKAICKILCMMFKE